MELTQLRYFQAVAATQNITRAAEQLHIAQPTLSKVIQRLERDLGVALFDRHAARLELNEYGHAFLAYCNQALLTLERGCQRLDAIRLSNQQRIRVAHTFFGLPHLLLEHFAIENPEIALSNLACSAQEAGGLLAGDQVDFLLSISSIIHPEVEECFSFREPLVLLLPGNRPPRPAKRAALAEFRDERFAIFESSSEMEDFILDLCRKAQFVPNIVYKSDYTNRTGWMLNRLDCCTLIPMHPTVDNRSAEDEAGQVILLEDADCFRTIHVYSRREGLRSELNQRFFSFLQAYFQEVQDSLAAALRTYQTSY